MRRWVLAPIALPELCPELEAAAAPIARMGSPQPAETHGGWPAAAASSSGQSSGSAIGATTHLRNAHKTSPDLAGPPEVVLRRPWARSGRILPISGKITIFFPGSDLDPGSLARTSDLAS